MGESTLQRAVKIAKQQAQEAALRAMWEKVCPNCYRHTERFDEYYPDRCYTDEWVSVYGRIFMEPTFDNCPLVGQTRKELDGGTPKGNVGDNPQTEVEK